MITKVVAVDVVDVSHVCVCVIDVECLLEIADAGCPTKVSVRRGAPSVVVLVMRRQCL